MTVESIYESFLTLLMAGIQSGAVCWKAEVGKIISFTLCGETVLFFYFPFGEISVM